jgi:magnesium-transporting ATPase (P-type)
LRVLGFGFIEMSRNDWDNQFGSDPKVLEQALDESAMNLTFVGAVALKDPLRDKVKSCVTYARENSHINVRLVSGDHINTATAYAYKSGVLKSEEAEAGEYVIMTGEDFRNAVGTLVLYRNSETGDN